MEQARRPLALDSLQGEPHIRNLHRPHCSEPRVVLGTQDLDPVDCKVPASAIFSPSFCFFAETVTCLCTEDG